MGEDTPAQHALPITQIRDGKWSKNNHDVMKLSRVLSYGVPGKPYSNDVLCIQITKWK